MSKQKKIKTFVISTKGVFGSRKILEHIKNNIDGNDVNKEEADKIFKNIEKQIENG